MSIVEINGLTAVATAVVLVLFGLALRLRSWGVWLAGYLATLVTLLVAWRSR